MFWFADTEGKCVSKRSHEEKGKFKDYEKDTDALPLLFSSCVLQ